MVTQDKQLKKQIMKRNKEIADHVVCYRLCVVNIDQSGHTDFGFKGKIMGNKQE